ncbi:MAG: polynucleotide kinase-phosphatase [Gammaproteobacteria bacterium]|nr:polynucleotide kinase-phosphatase [Gammaproteobacteria bacterium]
MRIEIPEYCLVVLIGASGSGKSTFAAKHFAPTEVISSDTCRALVSDDANDQSATRDAFELLEFIARKRLAARRLTVVDATSVRPEDRAKLVRLAREFHAFAVAIVFDLPERVCQERNDRREDRDFGPRVVHNHVRLLRRSVRRLGREGFRYRFQFRSEAEADAAVVERQRLWTDRREDGGPFDIIGDVHGCGDELEALLTELGYRVDREGESFAISHPEARRLVFLGDLVDRGPRVADCLRLVMDAVDDGVALCVPGNHETKLLRHLRGRRVRLTHGLDGTVAQLESEPSAFRDRVAEFIDGLVSHYLFDDGKLAVAHAGMKNELLNRSSGAVREFALFGETTGETDEYGFPVRYDWASEYRGEAMIVYGHTPVVEAEWVNGTICIDTGCVFGGKLTALRYPERELVSVPAAKVYYPSTGRPLVPDADTADAAGDILAIDDVLGKRIVDTRLVPNITVREENAAAALEVMSRFAVQPNWLIYLPPTMSPCATRNSGDLLEHPASAFGYYRTNGVDRVVCQEKHMGSRAIAVVCRDADVARTRFGAAGATAGIIYTRTGRRFFGGQLAGFEQLVLDRLRAAADRCGLWDKLDTPWLILDCELMPWSVKAADLVREQYASVADAAGLGLAQVVDALERAVERGADTAELVNRFRGKAEMVKGYEEAVGRYNWPVDTVDDLKLAPFHLLATETAVHDDKDHGWHMERLAELCQGDGLLTVTDYRLVELDDDASCSEAIAWWEALTAAGGEGMVVKPWDFVVRSGKGLVQPAIKCRGREYLRIIYGPEYTAEENLARLRQRSLGAKRSLARREFALGLEALHRFVEREPLRRVHECVFAVLAMESEPVDPRL